MTSPVVRTALGGTQWTAACAIELRAIRAMPGAQDHALGELQHKLIDRQLDFIRSLSEIGPESALELRYLREPTAPGRIRVYFLIRSADSSEQAAHTRCEEAASYVERLLMLNDWVHAFEPVTDPPTLDRLHVPFEFEEIVDLTRRSERIVLDRVTAEAAAVMGFRISAGRADSSEAAPEKAPSIHFVYPFILTFDTMERLCGALLLQESPCFVSIGLRPYRLTREDRQILLDRMLLCEKFAQLNIAAGVPDHVEELAPFLKKQAETLYWQCSRTLRELEDAAFQLTILLVSAAPIRPEVAALVGTSVTEHAGHPRTLFQSDRPDGFSGGYRSRRLQDRESTAAALRRLGPFGPPPPDSPEGRWCYVATVSQAGAAMRLPLPTAGEFPGIETIQYQQRAAPTDLPAKGLLLGQNLHFGQLRNIYWPEEARSRHAYVVGQTGTGKSNLFLNMILQDLAAGHGVGVIDPHGELIDDLLVRIPPSRIQDVVYLDPADLDRPFGINILEHGSSREKDFCVNYLLEVFDQLYDLEKTGGPVFELYMRNALLLLLDQRPRGAAGKAGFPTVLDVPRIFQSQDFRTDLLRGCDNVFVKEFWQEAERTGGDLAIRNIAPYITSKLSRFVHSRMIQGVVGQRRSSVDFRGVLDGKKILLLDLRKGVLGRSNSEFLGMLVIGRLFYAAMSRTTAPDKASLAPFYLYVDEFHSLATPTFVSILSEARKYALGLVVTNQYIAQLPPSIVRAIFGNVGTLVAFRVGAADAEVLGHEFGGGVTGPDLVGMSNWNAHIRLLAGGDVTAPFTMRTLKVGDHGDPDLGGAIRQASRDHYGTDRRELDREIEGTLLARE